MPITQLTNELPGTSAASLPSPFIFTRVGNQMFFRSYDHVLGTHIWVTDGTTAGTTRTLDVATSNPVTAFYPDAISYGGSFFFAGNSARLWKSTGAGDDITLVSDFYPGMLQSPVFTPHNGKFCFVVQSSQTGSQSIWKTDGTSSGTQPLFQADCERSSSSNSIVGELNGILAFSTVSTTDTELWRTDDSCEGTTRVATFPMYSVVNRATMFNGRLYFAVSNTSLGLWVSDLTVGGTYKLIDQYTAYSTTSSLGLFVASASKVWKIDPSDSVTTLVTNLNVVSLSTVNDHVFFRTGSTSPNALYTTDGTPEGTRQLFSGNCNPPVYYNGFYYFAGSAPSNKAALWRTDGTTAVVEIATTAVPGSTFLLPEGLQEFDGQLYFAGRDTRSGLWKSDGTDEGTTLIRVLDAVQNGLVPDEFIDVGTFALFSGISATAGRELWRTDGTAEGTFLLKDIRPGVSGSSPANFAALNGVAYFSADDGVHGIELWRSDGTPAGTYLAQDSNAGSASSSISNLYAANGRIYYTGNGAHPWTSDGTDPGTYQLANIQAGYINGGGALFTAFDNLVYFRAADSTHGYELWRTDGTASGTQLFADLNPGSSDGKPWAFCPIGNTLFFQAWDTAHSYELWKTDGSDTGTTLVKDIVPGTAFSVPDYLVNWDGTLYFETYKYPSGGYDIWKSDGTGAGTTLAVDPNQSSGYLDSLIPAGNSLYFRYNTKIFKWDGTTAMLIADMGYQPGSWGTNLFYLNGWIFYVSGDTTFGAELSAVDCLQSTASLACDFLPGTKSSSPEILGVSNGKLFVSAYQEYGDMQGPGRQLWVIAPPANFPATVADWQLY